MGVDWFTCEICGTVFNDCGYYGWCAGCGERICDSCHGKAVDKYGQVEEDSDDANEYGDGASVKCDLCSGEVIYDKDVMEYLLTQVGKTRDDIVTEISRVRGL